jgi:tetratricopeptide (TPR) repeat protein
MNSALRDQHFIAKAILSAALSVVGPRAPSADLNPSWVEVRSAHFVVASNAGERDARLIADQFERVRSIFHRAFVNFRVDPLQPIVILAARDEATMKMLAPNEWEREGHVHPTGLFHSDGDKDYVVLRLDAEGTTAFHTIYHEYTHALLHLNFKRLPVWLSEGLAEFFGNSTLGDKDVRTGAVNKTHLYVLSKNEWLPIEALFNVTETSPHYNEKNPASIFYAESWAVTHYLLLDPGARREQVLNKFVAAWDKSGDPVEAGREAFGDLERFGEKIRRYVRTTNWRLGLVLPAQEDPAGNIVARHLSAGEVLALRGDFLVHHDLLDQARPLLELAVQLEPGLAATHEALGFYDFRDSDFVAADEEMSKAIELGSQDFTAFYCHGVLLLRDLAATDEATWKARKALEIAARLNPRYAPTFEALTQAYSRAADTQAKALEAARTAVELEPDSSTYRFGLAYVLLNNGRAADAGAVAQRLLASAGSADETRAVRKLIDTIDEELEWEKESEQEAKLEARNAREPPKTGVLSNPDAAPVRPAIARRQLGPPEWMAVDGPIAAIDCGHGPEVTLTLDLAKGPLSFHAADFERVGTSGMSEAAVPELESCKRWVGRRVKIWFRWIQGQDYVGEITKIHFF